jgi:hypothetical protein
MEQSSAQEKKEQIMITDIPLKSPGIQVNKNCINCTEKHTAVNCKLKQYFSDHYVVL